MVSAPYYFIIRNRFVSRNIYDKSLKLIAFLRFDCNEFLR